MKLVIFAVADEGHFINTDDSYGRVIKLDDSDKIATLNEITDEEYYELFPEERPVPEEVTEGEGTPEEIPEDVTDTNVGDNTEVLEEDIPAEEPIS